VAVETSGTWNQSAIELIQEIVRHITAVTEDTRETLFLFQRLSIALQRRNAVAFLATFVAVFRVIPRRGRCLMLSIIFMPVALCWYNNNNNDDDDDDNMSG